jgi:hypothetical protein
VCARIEGKRGTLYRLHQIGAIRRHGWGSHLPIQPGIDVVKANFLSANLETVQRGMDCRKEIGLFI